MILRAHSPEYDDSILSQANVRTALAGKKTFQRGCVPRRDAHGAESQTIGIASKKSGFSLSRWTVGASFYCRMLLLKPRTVYYGYRA